MNNPHPFIVIIDDPVCEDTGQMAAIIAASLQDSGRFIIASYLNRTDELPPGSVTVVTP